MIDAVFRPLGRGFRFWWFWLVGRLVWLGDSIDRLKILICGLDRPLLNVILLAEPADCLIEDRLAFCRVMYSTDTFVYVTQEEWMIN